MCFAVKTMSMLASNTRIPVTEDNLILLKYKKVVKSREMSYTDTQRIHKMEAFYHTLDTI